MLTIERFEAKVWIVEDTCHLWMGGLNNEGYAMFWFDKKVGLAHRYAWLQAYGSLPPAPLELDHLCRKRSCVNVLHLEPVTRSVNTQRGLKGNRETCRAGLHAWTPGSSRCPECSHDYNVAYWRNRKELAS